MADKKSRKNTAPDLQPEAADGPVSASGPPPDPATDPTTSATAPGPDPVRPPAAAKDAGKDAGRKAPAAPADSRRPVSGPATGPATGAGGGAARSAPAARTAAPPRRSGAAALALLLAILAAALGGYAAWRVMVMERADGNRYHSLGQQLDALDVRLAETDRRAARSNELAATLREQLAESERLQARMREDVLALADRNARSESLLAEMARGQRSARQQLALADAVGLISQAELRLRLFADREGAGNALALAEGNLARIGGSHADLRHAVASARSTLADDPRPSTAALLRELDALAAGLDGLVIRLERAADGPAGSAAGGWWARQFQRLDRLVSIRHEDEAGIGVMPTRDGVRRALDRARLAALENDLDGLPDALRALRSALVACCEPESAAALTGRLERLLAVNWSAPLPDLAALRARLEDLAVIDQLPAAAPATVADDGGNASDPEQEEGGP